VLLRDALVESGKVAIAKVVIRTRQHLAAVKPQKKGRMLELMHFRKNFWTLPNSKNQRKRQSEKQRCRWRSSSSKA
jgi:DNA end-binding protein Ku